MITDDKLIEALGYSFYLSDDTMQIYYMVNDYGFSRLVSKLRNHSQINGTPDRGISECDAYDAAEEVANTIVDSVNMSETHVSLNDLRAIMANTVSTPEEIFRLLKVHHVRDVIAEVVIDVLVELDEL